MKHLYIILFILPFFGFGQTLLLYSSDNNTFLGCLNCSSYDSNSICNEYGTYGNSYSSYSIWNDYGTYGNSYSSYSPWNDYSSNGPKIVDKNGNYYGRFTINTYSLDSYSNSSDLEKIYEYFKGDLDKVRDHFCQ